jgi:AraC-like DNA-binding protein
VDTLAHLLDGPRAREAFLLRPVMARPWAIRVQDEAPLSVTAVVRGRVWVTPDDGDPVRLGPGDVAVTRGPDPFTFADDPASPVGIVVDPDQVCRTPAGDELVDALTLGVRTWGTDPDGPDDMLVGTYIIEGDVSRPLLNALPPLLVVRAEQLDSPIVGLLSAEMTRHAPGQDAVLDRLLDLLLIATLRAWFDRPDGEAPAWYRAQSDPLVGHALRLIYSEPARRWTVASLAAEVGMSRAALARRFTELVGTPPMTFLGEWRLGLAADLLRQPDVTLAWVARQVGYASPYALSTAFKRSRGISPRDNRLAAAG